MVTLREALHGKAPHVQASETTALASLETLEQWPWAQE